MTDLVSGVVQDIVPYQAQTRSGLRDAFALYVNEDRFSGWGSAKIGERNIAVGDTVAFEVQVESSQDGKKYKNIIMETLRFAPHSPVPLDEKQTVLPKPFAKPFERELDSDEKKDRRTALIAAAEVCNTEDAVLDVAQRFYNFLRQGK